MYHIYNSKFKVQKINQLLFLLSIVFCLVFFLWLLRALFLGFYPDFSGYYYGSKYLFSGLNPYLGGGSLYTQYVYPPVVLILFFPFTLFNFQTAEIAWTILNFILLFASLFYLSKIFSINFFSKTNLLLMSLVFISFPTKFTLGMGQINILVLWLMVYGIWLMKKRKEFLSGIFLGVSLVIKLFPILLPVYFLLNFNKKILLGMFVSFIAPVLLVLFFIPQKIYLNFVFQTFPTLITSWKLDYYNQALSGVIGRSFGTGSFSTSLKIILSSIVVFITFFAILKNRQKDFVSTSLKIGTIITASLLINTFSWQHHFIWLIIPFYASFCYLRASATSMFAKQKKLKVWYFVILGISYILISMNFSDPKVLPILFQSHVFFGTLILLFLSLKLLFLEQS